MTNLFDGQAFSQELRTAMASMSLRKLQAITGVDQASIHRATKGLTPSLETYLRLRAWIDNSR